MYLTYKFRSETTREFSLVELTALVAYEIPTQLSGSLALYQSLKVCQAAGSLHEIKLSSMALGISFTSRNCELYAELQF